MIMIFPTSYTLVLSHNYFMNTKTFHELLHFTKLFGRGHRGKDTNATPYLKKDRKYTASRYQNLIHDCKKAISRPQTGECLRGALLLDARPH